MTEHNNKEYLQFWNERYAKHQFEWGQSPSVLALNVVKRIPEGGRVLDVACGYGRDTVFLAKNGYRSYGMDLSLFAIERAREWTEHENLQIAFRQDELINCNYPDNYFDGVIMYNTLHLLWQQKREEIIFEINRILKPGGSGMFAFFSTKEKGFGSGVEVETNSFARGKGRMRHYFTKGDIRKLFCDYSDITAEEFFIPPEEHEHHGRKKHGHQEWLVTVVK